MDLHLYDWLHLSFLIWEVGTLMYLPHTLVVKVKGVIICQALRPESGTY